ncbi:MAG: tyrosine-type recombinase/integrase [Candidatus Dormibacteria bacterium]
MVLVGGLRVQEISRGGGWRSWTVLWPEGAVHVPADRFLGLHEGSGTQRTYAYLLVDHLRWLERECLAVDVVTLRDLERYMGIVGAEVRMPLGEPWRVGKRPYGKAALSSAAACLKGFYLHQAACGVNEALGRQLDRTRLPTRADRNRALLGHAAARMPSNSLAPRRVLRRHPKMLPENARERLSEVVTSARDRMVITWLADGGFRIGELCGLHLVDLHLRESARCGECRAPHVHICHRAGNVNRAAAKTKFEWSVQDATVRGGLIRRVSPAMIHTYFEYVTTEYPRQPGHEMLLVGLHGEDAGRPWTTDAARGMLRRAGARAGLGLVKPHAFRHSFATAVLDASGGNLVVTREAGGWASATTVDEIYAHADVHDPVFDGALRTVWGEQR